MDDAEQCTSQNGLNQQSVVEPCGYYIFSYENVRIKLPMQLVTNPSTFFATLSPSAWHGLNSLDKERLMMLLPGCSDDKEKEQIAIDLLGGKKNFFFGNPLVQFYQKLRCGFYELSMQYKLSALRRCSRLQYECWIRNHFSDLLKTLLLNRRALLLQVLDGASVSHARRPNRNSIDVEGSKHEAVQKRALTRARLMIMNCKSKVNESSFSSDDDDIAETVKYGSAVFSKAHDDINSLSTLGRLDTADLDLYKPILSSNFKRMLSEYRLLRKTHKDHPTLDFSDITLEGIVERSGMQNYFAKIVDRSNVADQGGTASLAKSSASSALQRMESVGSMQTAAPVAESVSSLQQRRA